LPPRTIEARIAPRLAARAGRAGSPAWMTTSPCRGGAAGKGAQGWKQAGEAAHGAPSEMKSRLIAVGRALSAILEGSRCCAGRRIGVGDQRAGGRPHRAALVDQSGELGVDGGIFARLRSPSPPSTTGGAAFLSFSGAARRLDGDVPASSPLCAS
jgi:hypothetical protein